MARDEAEELERDPATGVYVPTGRTAPIARPPALRGSVFSSAEGVVLRKWLEDLAKLPIELVASLLRNGRRLVVGGALIYAFGPSLLSGYVSGKVAARSRRPRRRKRKR